MNVKCTARSCQAPSWASIVLRFAGIYNILFGIWAIAWPMEWFHICDMQTPIYTCFWRGLGMIIALFGVGYLVAASAPLRHWPIVLIGFLAKSGGLIAFLWAISQAQIPWSMGWLALTNSLIWLIPFTIILWHALCVIVGTPVNGEPMPLADAINQSKLNTGETLREASEKQLLAIVFLRHFGCTFTRQLLQKLEVMERETQARGAKLILVHMLQEGDEVAYVRNENIARIADPWCDLYRAFGLGKGGFWELFGPSVWLRGTVSFFKGCGVGHLAGDGLQMPGAFLMQNGEIIRSQKAKTAADLPEVESLFEEIH